ncbi:hypothetical protein EBW23_07255, partial [bacterium]|nr:hypothetical protein [bacterium]
MAHATGITKPTSENSNGFVDHTQDPEAIPQKMAETQVLEVVDIEILEEVVEQDEIVFEVTAEEIAEEVVETNITSIHEEQIGMSDHPSTDAPVAERMAEVVQLFGKKRREATVVSVDAPIDSPEPEQDLKPPAKVEAPKFVEVKSQTSKTSSKTPAK